MRSITRPRLSSASSEIALAAVHLHRASPTTPRAPTLPGSPSRLRRAPRRAGAARTSCRSRGPRTATSVQGQLRVEHRERQARHQRTLLQGLQPGEGHDGGSGVVSGTPTVICTQQRGDTVAELCGLRPSAGSSSTPTTAEWREQRVLQAHRHQAGHMTPQAAQASWARRAPACWWPWRSSCCSRFSSRGLLQFAVTSFTTSNAVISRERATYSAEAAVHTQSCAWSNAGARGERAAIRDPELQRSRFFHPGCHGGLAFRKPTAAQSARVSTVPTTRS